VKVLLNTSSCRTGGALQTSSAFIIEALRDPAGIEWTFAAPREGVRQLEQFGVPIPATMTVFDEAPASSRTARRALRALEDRVQPDCVLTFSGPSYVRFRSFHVVGCSAPWVTHPNWAAFRSLGSLRNWADCLVRTAYKSLWFRRADAWIAQTEAGAHGLAKRLGLPADRITVIPNTCGERYRTEHGEKPFPMPGQPIRLLYFSAPYKHKNFEVLPYVARELAARLPGLDFKIIVTLPAEHRLCKSLMASAHQLGVAGCIENAGPIPVAQGPAMYRRSDICFAPTLLETFSATYPEAMAMGLPIVTTDLDFAHDVCDDAALYFRPQDASSATDCLTRLLSDAALWQRQIARGKEVLPRFPTPRQRYEAYARLLLSYRDASRARV
jgi:glycosyltransferase involved in cell wall biosynthesis